MSRRLATVLAADMVGYTRLMQMDEAATLTRQRHYRQTLIDPRIAAAGGRIVKSTGDGLLVVFDVLRAAVDTAIAIQTAMTEAESDTDEERRIRYRVGITLGDLIVEDDDVFGDVVNLAARLETLAEPGGICLSDPVRQLLDPATQDQLVDLGRQRMKNMLRPVRTWQWSPESRLRATRAATEASIQTIGFCQAEDGVQLAYSKVGTGPDVLKAPNWMNHLDYEWQSPLGGQTIRALSRAHRLVRFDQRGNGLSDWDVPDLTEDTMIADMRSVVAASGLHRFALFGQSQGCAFSVRFAAENPDAVTCLVLVGGYARGALRRGSQDEAALHETTTTLILQGWGSVNPAYRRVFTETMIPEANAEQRANLDELQRIATSPQNAARINDMNARIDVSAQARRINVPTLVMHCTADRRVPMEEGRRLAALIPGAEFVALPGANHLPLEGTEAFEIFRDRLDSFLKNHAGR